MKHFITIITIVIAVAANAGSIDLLQRKLDAAIAGSDWKTAEAVSRIMANMTMAENHRQQAEFFKKNNEAAQAVLNVYKGAPAMLRVAQTLLSPEKGTEEHLMLHTVFPNVVKLVSTGEFDEAGVITGVKAFKQAEKDRVEARRKKWAEDRKRWEQRRNKR